MSRIPLFLALGLTFAAGVAFVSLPRANAAGQSPCSVTTFSDNGVQYRILFAKNGAVQQYVLAQSSHNLERDHDTLQKLIDKYGPAAVNAPPVKIVGFRPGSNGMLIPDKAVDSCGRISYFK